MKRAPCSAGRGYRSFHFLLGLSDQIPNFGLEHHECTVNTVSPSSLRNDPRARWWLTFLLAHEYTPSWNGNHRRPADMLAANFHKDLKTDLLWVYEGLTQYLRPRARCPLGFLDEAAISRRVSRHGSRARSPVATGLGVASSTQPSRLLWKASASESELAWPIGLLLRRRVHLARSRHHHS